MNTKRCPYCGASVKKENFNGHIDRLHPNLPISSTSPSTVFRTGSIFRSHRKRNVAILALVALAVVGLSIGASSFAAANTMRMHVHPVVSAVINGNAQSIPADIGIASNLWVDHSLDQYGMSGMAPLHTHDSSGTVHVESNTVRNFTLQEFLHIWGQSLDTSQVLGHPVDAGHHAYVVVDGVQMSPTSTIVLRDGEQIKIVCGP